MIVDLLPNDDQALVLDSVRGFLASELPVERLRDETAFQGQAEGRVWSQLVDLGLFGLGVSEDDGGVGYGIAEEALVVRELGRALVSPDVLSTLLAAHATDGETRAALIGGELRAALAAPTGDGSIQVFDGSDAGLALLPNGLQPIDALGALEDRSSLDETVRLRRSGVLAGAQGDGRSVATRAGVLFSCYLAGVAEAARDIAVAYVKVREQFGQPIGAFQAVKHLCADMAMRAEAATAQAFFAALVVDSGEDATADLNAASLLTTEAALENARAAIQLHGGMGFTYECDAHFYLKRAHVVSTALKAWNRTLL
jgi:alkylation response protein AidB-like acyl-CoA dehydrogenase